MQAAAEGRFLPGDRLVEAEIARDLNVSRVPVREALRLLESQGIVINVPYRGMRLMDVDTRHLQRILVVRASLERLAAREAAAAYRRDPPSLAPLEAAMADMRAAAHAGSGYELARADAAFHRALCRVGGNDVLEQIWEALARKLTIIVGLSALQKDLSSIVEEHVELLEVIKRGVGAEIDRAVDFHVIDLTERVDFDALIRSRREA